MQIVSEDLLTSSSMILFNSVFTSLGNKLLRPHLVSQIRKKLSSQDLFEIGHFDNPKLVTNYVAGQMFVHKVLGYRGLIIFPWVTQVYSKGLMKTDNTSDSDQLWGINHKQTYYYQVLIDSRDVPFTRIKNESAPLLIKLEKGLHSLPDSDYAAHDDILPYTVTQKEKFHHDLLDHFFHYHPDDDICYEAKHELKSWQEKTSKRLEFTDVYVQVTENVRVTVMPFFIGLRKTRRFVRFFWRYTIRLENVGNTTVTVKKHKLRIFCSQGTSIYKTGSGVAGVEPILNKALPVFQYGSYISLRSPCGHVRGILEIEREDGSSFHCNVPMFPLQSGEKC